MLEFASIMPVFCSLLLPVDIFLKINPVTRRIPSVVIAGVTTKTHIYVRADAHVIQGTLKLAKLGNEFVL